MPDDTENNNTGSVSLNRIRPRATEIESQTGSKVGFVTNLLFLYTNITQPLPYYSLFLVVERTHATNQGEHGDDELHRLKGE